MDIEVVVCEELKPTKNSLCYFLTFSREFYKKTPSTLLSDSIAKTKVDICKKILRVINQIKIWLFYLRRPQKSLSNNLKLVFDVNPTWNELRKQKMLIFSAT